MRWLRLTLIGVMVGASVAGCTQQTDREQKKHLRKKDDDVRVAGIVLKWIKADKERNFERAVPLIRQAAARGAKIVITTECFLDGYAVTDKMIPPKQFLALGEPIPDGPYARKLAALADELNIYLVAGMLERQGDHTYNTAAFFAPDGKLIGKYRKQDIGHELLCNTPGRESPVFETKFGRVGLIICADRRNPEVVRRIASRSDLVICPSGGMWGPKNNDPHLQSRSKENHVPIVFVHPIEFLVTGADGSILDRKLIGEDMDIPVDKIDSPADSHQVVIYDLTLTPKHPTT